MSIRVSFGVGNSIERPDNDRGVSSVEALLANKNLLDMLGAPENIEVLVDGQVRTNGAIAPESEVELCTKSNSKAKN